MYKNDLISQTAQTGKGFTIQDLPVELVELSDEDLAQVCGGVTWGEILYGLGGYGKPRPTTPPRPPRIPGWHSLSEPSDLEMLVSPHTLPTLSLEFDGSLIIR
jgi:hypothetical protein